MTRTAALSSRLTSRSTLFAMATLATACSRALTIQSPAPSDTRTIQERLGYPATAKLLILHADDVGMSHSVNRASLEALEKGWITSASILVPSPWFAEVATWARAHPDADLGIHLALGQSYGLPVLLERTSVPGAPPAPPWAERARSLALVDRVLQMMPGVSREQWVDAYKTMLAPLGPGVYELILHLGYDDDEMRGATFDHPDWGAAWRQWDFDLVRSAEFRDWLKQQGFQLITWRELAKARKQ